MRVWELMGLSKSGPEQDDEEKQTNQNLLATSTCNAT